MFYLYLLRFEWKDAKGDRQFKTEHIVSPNPNVAMDYCKLMYPGFNLRSISSHGQPVTIVQR